VLLKMQRLLLEMPLKLQSQLTPLSVPLDLRRLWLERHYHLWLLDARLWLLRQLHGDLLPVRQCVNAVIVMLLMRMHLVRNANTFTKTKMPMVT
jgi:hypothetical protein